jgi:hypothetical protein
MHPSVTAVRLLSPLEEGLPPSIGLAATLYLPGPAAGRPAPGLVVAHGAGSRAARHAQFCLEACCRGFAVLAPDLRGHGDSQGRGDGLFELDVLAAAQFLRGRPEVDPRRICYRGSSMGGFYGLKAAPEAGFAAMVLICPASEEQLQALLRSIDGEPGDQGDTEAPGSAATGGSTRWDTPRLRAYFERQDSRGLAAKVLCPVLLVHARPDERVPFAHSLVLAQCLRSETTLLALATGNHSSAQHDPAIHAYSLDWLLGKVAGA